METANLAGRVAVVTGASQGIGRACALKLARCGVAVGLVSRNKEKLEEVAAEITRSAAEGHAQKGSGASARALVVAADVENEDQV